MPVRPSLQSPSIQGARLFFPSYLDRVTFSANGNNATLIVSIAGKEVRLSLSKEAGDTLFRAARLERLICSLNPGGAAVNTLTLSVIDSASSSPVQIFSGMVFASPAGATNASVVAYEYAESKVLSFNTASAVSDGVSPVALPFANLDNVAAGKAQPKNVAYVPTFSVCFVDTRTGKRTTVQAPDASDVLSGAKYIGNVISEREESRAEVSTVCAVFFQPYSVAMKYAPSEYHVPTSFTVGFGGGRVRTVFFSPTAGTPQQAGATLFFMNAFGALETMQFDRFVVQEGNVESSTLVADGETRTVSTRTNPSVTLETAPMLIDHTTALQLESLARSPSLFFYDVKNIRRMPLRVKSAKYKLVRSSFTEQSLQITLESTRADACAIDVTPPANYGVRVFSEQFAAQFE